MNPVSLQSYLCHCEEPKERRSNLAFLYHKHRLPRRPKGLLAMTHANRQSLFDQDGNLN